MKTARSEAGHSSCSKGATHPIGEYEMNNIIYIVGLVVIVLAVLGWLGFR